MLNRPCLKPHLRLAALSQDETAILWDGGVRLLSGAAVSRTIRLLDGTRTCEEVIREASGRLVYASQVATAIEQLERAGFLCEAEVAEWPAAVNWCALGIDPGGALDAVGRLRVGVRALGGIDASPLAQCLAAWGFQEGPEAGIDVVAVDDYLRPELDALNRTALESRRPWMLVRPLGTTLWIGPLFRPGEGACWECLAQRLRAHRRLPGGPEAQPPQASAWVALAWHLAATEVARALLQTGGPTTLTTWDIVQRRVETHTLVHRPQCPACGDPEWGRRHPAPVVLESRPKRFTGDGGHRVLHPEETFARLRHHLSPVTGVVSWLKRQEGDDRDVFAYAAGGPLFRRSAGKGKSDAQAKASALCEALERYCWHVPDHVCAVRGRYSRMGGDAVHPNDLLLFSEAQYRDREAWNRRVPQRFAIPEPLDEDAEGLWTPVWSLTQGAWRHVALDGPERARVYGLGSNGLAAGNVIEEAILQGFLELVERDCTAMWWRNRIPRPEVPLESIPDPYVDVLRRRYEALGRQVWMLDITNDLGIPTFVAISRRVDGGPEGLVAGMGTHLDPAVAALRALTEATQPPDKDVRDLVQGARLRSRPGDPWPEWVRDWLLTATVENQPYVAPDPAQPPRPLSYYRSLARDDVRDDVEYCVDLVRKLGLDTLVMDMTRPDIGLHVVRVMVPGLRNHWPQYAPGRLYDVPVALGWLAAPLREEEMNPYQILN